MNNVYHLIHVGRGCNLPNSICLCASLSVLLLFRRLSLPAFLFKHYQSNHHKAPVSNPLAPPSPLSTSSSLASLHSRYSHSSTLPALVPNYVCSRPNRQSALLLQIIIRAEIRLRLAHYSPAACQPLCTLQFSQSLTWSVYMPTRHTPANGGFGLETKPLTH
ncbi:unnamed protein product [Protopolystoma xenopodis]|uniref:Uncharacterized protein n=1 Tax=Protopolystoma xenopodis TaxID=117903 RepID=A0A3S5ABQ2_9PLAT|nr:unnamed protein product [Protopolystoma xenopodis]